MSTKVGRHIVHGRPRHALTLKSKGQRSNPNSLVRVLTFAMWRGRYAEQRECACRYGYTFFFLVAHYFYQAATRAIKTYIRPALVCMSI